jgi:hypothetical protein
MRMALPYMARNGFLTSFYGLRLPAKLYGRRLAKRRRPIESIYETTTEKLGTNPHASSRDQILPGYFPSSPSLSKASSQRKV